MLSCAQERTESRSPAASTPVNASATPTRPGSMPALPRDLWLLVFQELAGDYQSLLSISLVSRDWRVISWPCLLQVVDLSSHNLEPRLSDLENSALPVIRSHHHAKYRPKNLVPRQRSFLSLLTAQPHLAKHVKSFTWTLVWRDAWRESDSSPLSDIDCETWNVFASLINVTSLDLASIHDVWDVDLVRESPEHLFPKVMDLRLLGWMHRGLVKAIVNTIDATKLQSLRLDFLEDQGALPDGGPLCFELPPEFAPTARRLDTSTDELLVDDAMLQRQETGKVAIFPGPMWLPMRLLSARSLDSLQHLRLTVPYFDVDRDVRNYFTVFRDSAVLLRKVSQSLQSLVVIFDESHMHYFTQSYGCGNGRTFHTLTYRPWCIRMAAAFLKHIIGALSECSFPKLDRLAFEGFHVLECKEASQELEDALQHLKHTPFENVNLTETSHVDGRLNFEGFDCTIPEIDETVLRNS